MVRVPARGDYAIVAEQRQMMGDIVWRDADLRRYGLHADFIGTDGQKYFQSRRMGRKTQRAQGSRHIRCDLIASIAGICHRIIR